LQSDSGGSSRHLVTYVDGQAIFAQGDQGEDMYIVQDGQVEIVLEAPEGEVSLATLERGDFFGEMAVIEGAPRTATARSKGGCKLLPLRGALFIEMLQRDPETTLRIMRKLCSRIRQLQGRLAELVDDPISFVGEAAPAPVPPAPAPERIGARLVHATGVVLELPDTAVARVGRPDSSVGSVPEIDLTPLNEARTVSRAHAKIVRRDGSLFVVAEPGTTNGTYVDGQLLEAGVPREVRAGASVTFGTVTLKLELAPSSAPKT
jgi:CRP-like cAMP-binding protein